MNIEIYEQFLTMSDFRERERENSLMRILGQFLPKLTISEAVQFDIFREVMCQHFIPIVFKMQRI